MGCADTKEIVEARINHLNHLYEELGNEIAAEKRKLEEKGYVTPKPPKPFKVRPHKRAKKKKPKAMSQFEAFYGKKRYNDDYFTGLYYYNESLKKKKNMSCARLNPYGYDFNAQGEPIGYNSHNEEEEEGDD